MKNLDNKRISSMRLISRSPKSFQNSEKLMKLILGTTARLLGRVLASKKTWDISELRSKTPSSEFSQMTAWTSSTKWLTKKEIPQTTLTKT